MATTQEQIDKLDRAMAKGLLEVRYGEKIIKYQSVEDMQKARAGLVSILASQDNPLRSSPRYQLADFRDDR